MKKKILSIFMAICLILPCGFALSACSQPKENEQIVNLSLNPAIELIVDKNDKVLSVNALNDEGNFIIAKSNFENLNLEQATEQFLDVASENGFLVEGSITADQNQLEISTSGKSAQKLYNKVKGYAEGFFENTNFSLNISLEDTISTDDIRQLVGKCMQEMTPDQLDDLSHNKLMTLLKESREETKTFLSQELKEFYYQARADEIMQAEFDKVSDFLLAIPNPEFQAMGEQLQQSIQTFYTYLETFRTEFIEQFLSGESNYQAKMQDFIEAKKALLEARLAGIDTTDFETQLALAETTLENAKDLADISINNVNSQINTALTSLKSALAILASFFDQSEIKNAIQTVKNEFNAEFKTNFATYINNNYWNNLTPDVAE